MADFVHPTTLEVVLSVNDEPSPWVVLSRADALAALAITSYYRKWTGTAVVEMTVGEKATVDAARLAAARAAAVAQLDRVEDVLRATVLLLLDELNAHAAKINSILTAIDGAATLSALKTTVAGIADYPARTVAQVRASIAAKLGT